MEEWSLKEWKYRVLARSRAEEEPLTKGSFTNRQPPRIQAGDRWERVLFGRQKTASQAARKDSCGEVKEEPGFIALIATQTWQSGHQKILFLKENQTTQVSFYAWEDASGRAHWNHSFDLHLGYLGPEFSACSPVSLQAAPWGGCGCQLPAVAATPFVYWCVGDILCDLLHLPLVQNWFLFPCF